MWPSAFQRHSYFYSEKIERWRKSFKISEKIQNSIEAIRRFTTRILFLLKIYICVAWQMGSPRGPPKIKFFGAPQFFFPPPLKYIKFHFKKFYIKFSKISKFQKLQKLQKFLNISKIFIKFKKLFKNYKIQVLLFKNSYLPGWPFFIFVNSSYKFHNQ